MRRRTGFTLIELMVVVAVIGILAAIGTAQYSSGLRKAADGVTKGNLGVMRSALSIYYGDNEAMYPVDNLDCLVTNTKYVETPPLARVLPYHDDTILVTAETSVSETSGWSYNNDNASNSWGIVKVGCLHEDTVGQIWSNY